jgi:hypothetical protein
MALSSILIALYAHTCLASPIKLSQMALAALTLTAPLSVSQIGTNNNAAAKCLWESGSDYSMCQVADTCSIIPWHESEMWQQDSETQESETCISRISGSFIPGNEQKVVIAAEPLERAQCNELVSRLQTTSFNFVRIGTLCIGAPPIMVALAVYRELGAKNADMEIVVCMIG